MADKDIEILLILRQYFKLDLKAAEATRRIWAVKQNLTVFVHTIKNWPKYFRGVIWI